LNDILADSKIEVIPFDLLKLDPENPRLLKFKLKEGELTEEKMVSALLARFDPEPVGRSIVEFGFFASEPLIVFPSGDAFIVAEGNRRLVALKLLLDSDLRAAVEAGDVWDKLASQLSEDGDRLAQLKEIPCQTVPDREAAAPIIGYRHIVGILKWDAFEKAAYVVRLLRDGNNRTFEEVADLTGETPRRVKRYLRDWLVIEQAENAGVDVERPREEFGRWEPAMHAKGVREYIEATSPTELEPASETAYSGQDDQMERLVSFLYGEENGPDRIFTDTRRIDDFSVALQSEDGRRILEEERDLESAFEAAGGRKDYVLKGLAKALAGLQQARSEYADYAEDEAVVAAVTAIRDELDHLHQISEAEAGGADGDDFELSDEEEEDELELEGEQDEEGQ
jgi:hypothetical protein